MEPESTVIAETPGALSAFFAAADIVSSLEYSTGLYSLRHGQ